jgi:hypothetical protein
MPNKYFDLYDPESKARLLEPLEYIKRKDRKRNKQKIKAFFHGIRHSIVVIIKKILGMDPTKSIYN